MHKTFARKFGRGWVDAWNRHDLPAILAHYRDDVEMNSPFIPVFVDEPSGRLKGKEALARYWSKALAELPDLHFEYINALAGVDSVVVYYRGHRGMAAEVFHFDADGLVTKAFAHYE